MFDGSQTGRVADVMSDETFARFSEFVQNELGIKMPEAKKTMMQSRLLKRLRAVGAKTFEEYYDYVFGSQGMNHELINFIDVITTNKTDFFREPKHFDYLVKIALPQLIGVSGTGIRSEVRIWSAGCSTGEEPYTLAMVLSEFAIEHKGFQFSILATDISTKVLETAKIAIYEHEHAEPIPVALRKRYLLQSKDKTKKMVRIVPILRSLVRFQRLNFMDDDFGLSKPLDIIFCRNVLIYFNRQTQEKVLNRLCRYLNPGGFMFMGHSETLNGLRIPLVQAAPTIYRRI
jgi:chemotaxis protein methyltransferase CheR